VTGFDPEDEFVPGELTCQQLAELVTDYLEGALSSGDRARFDDHLGECENCATYVEQLRATIALTGRLAAGDIAPAARVELLAAFRGWVARDRAD
jgi:anti-sigma factor RsiW